MQEPSLNVTAHGLQSASESDSLALEVFLWCFLVHRTERSRDNSFYISLSTYIFFNFLIFPFFSYLSLLLPLSVFGFPHAPSSCLPTGMVGS